MNNLFLPLRHVYHNPLTVRIEPHSAHGTCPEWKTLSKRASLQLLSKLSGEDLLFICGESPVSEAQQENRKCVRLLFFSARHLTIGSAVWTHENRNAVNKLQDDQKAFFF